METLDPLYLYLSIVVSCLGFAAFCYGKARQDLKAILVGVALWIGTYFLSTAAQLLGFTLLMLVVLFLEPLVRWWERRRHEGIPSVDNG